mmetsp:Transcript_10105/g.15506  ORF Transcript_10105/g.15506 Transcript_10105/m.15506 type:complete len:125 (-) Transcript_10105:857-1231(-)
MSQLSPENCGFILHLLIVPAILIYITWVIVPTEVLAEWDITYYPPKCWSIYIPTSLLCAFIATLFANAIANAFMCPKIDSIDTIWDDHSRPYQSFSKSSAKNMNRLPEICDIDVSLINNSYPEK